MCPGIPTPGGRTLMWVSPDTDALTLNMAMHREEK